MTRRQRTTLLVGIVVLATATWVVGVVVWPRVEPLHTIAETAPLVLVFALAGYVIYARRLSRELSAAAREARDAVMEAAASDALLGAVVHSATDAIITSDSAATIRSFNAGAEAMFGLPATDAIGRNLSVLMPIADPDDHDVRDDGAPTVLGAALGVGREIVGRRDDGTEFPAHLTVNEIDQPDGKGFAAIIRDISDAAAAREALQASEEASRRMLAAIPEHVLRYRADGLILDFTPGGGPDNPADFIGKNAAEVFGDEPTAQLLACMERCFASGAVEREEYRLDGPEGSRYYEARHVAIASDEVLQISRDVTGPRQMREDLQALNADLEQRVRDRTLALEREVTERAAAEEAARTSELQFRELAENIPQVYWIMEPGAREFLYVSSRFQDVTGRDPADPWEDMVHPDDRDSVTQAKRLQSNGELEYTEYRIIRADGEVSWLGDRVFAMRSATGAPTRLFGVLEDITERREAELLQSVLYEIAETAHEAPDLPAMYAAIHESLKRIIDVPEFGIVLTTDDADTFHLVYDEPPDVRPFEAGITVHLPRSRTTAVANAREPRYFTADEARDLAESGDFDLHGSEPEAWLGVPLVVDDRLIGVARALHPTEPDPYAPRDVEIMTYVGRQIASAIERRRAQERLAEEQRLFQTLMDNAPTAIYFKDAVGRFTRVNRLCAAQRGHDDPDEMIGKTDTDYFTPEVARGFAADEERLLRTGEPVVNHLEPYDPPGASREWTLITKIPLFDADGVATELLGINLRVTELVEVQEALQANESERTLLMQRILAAQEEERARIALELHDQVGQELTSLLLELRVLEASPSWEVAKERASELRSLAAGTLEDVRRIAFEMRPSTLDDIGVVTALRRDLSNRAADADFEATFHVSDPDDLRLSGEADVVLYRVTHAAVTNIVQHAQASNVSVEIQARADDVLLTVRDDGVGFDADAVMAGPVEGKFGLLAMKERVAAVGGTVAFESTPGEGSVISIVIPYPDETVAADREDA